MRSHMTISPYVGVIGFEVSRVDPLWWGGILPSGHYGGSWGPTGLTPDDLWGISREAQPNSMSIGEDIRSRSNYPSTLTRRIAPTMWL